MRTIAMDYLFQATRRETHLSLFNAAVRKPITLENQRCDQMFKISIDSAVESD